LLSYIFTHRATIDVNFLVVKIMGDELRAASYNTARQKVN
jgi:hypothetical protein